MKVICHKSYNDVKSFNKAIKIKTEYLTAKCVEQGYPIFFSEVPDLTM